MKRPLATLVAVFLTLSVLLPDAVFAQVGTTPPETPTGASEMPTDPTVVLDPTPTATLVPTPTPPPAQVPTATIAPTVEPTPTPTLPAPTATATAPVTPTSPASPTAPVSPTPGEPSPDDAATPSSEALTPTPTQTPTGDVAPRAVVPGGSLPCEHISPGDIVDTNAYVRFRCVSQHDLPLHWITSLTIGWQYRIDNASNWSTTTGFLGLHVGSTFVIDLRPTNAAPIGATGRVVLETRNLALLQPQSAALAATRGSANTPPTTADLQLVCTPGTLVVNPRESTTVSCTFSGLTSLGTRQVRLTRIVVPAPAGWDIASAVGSTAGSTLTVNPNVTIAFGGQSYTFSFVLTPNCAASTRPTAMTLTSQYAYGSTTEVGGPSFAATVSRTNPTAVSAAVQSNGLQWTRTYSLTDSQVSGNLVYRASAAGCGSWTVQISATAFTYDGSYGGSAIPSSNLILDATGEPVVISGSGTGVARQPTSGPMQGAYTVLTAPVGTGPGVWEQQLDFTLTIPGRTRAGTYQSTIVVNISTGP